MILSVRNLALLSVFVISFIGVAKSAPYTCDDLGYIFEEGGCLDTSTMIRCPMDLSRVWCIGGEVCGQYPVKGAACNEGAKIESCVLTENKAQADKRCKYENDNCNQCWEKGVRTGDCGTNESCCKEGWVLDNGVCVEAKCDNTYYPYDTDNYDYAEYAGNIQICRSGNKVYFGYDGCNDMWEREGLDSSKSGYYKCLCRRTDYDNGYIFPYDKSTFYTTYAKGTYGDNQMCADAEGSYYGYTHCFRGYEMRKDAQGHKLGTCEAHFSIYCDASSKHPFESDIPEIRQMQASGYKCVYDDVCTEENQGYEECNVCMSADALKNGSSYVSICSKESSRNRGYKYKCPYNYQTFIGDTIFTGRTPSSSILSPSDDYAGICYGECEWGSNRCRLRDFVVKSGKPIGLVIKIIEQNKKFLVLAFKKNVVYNGNNNGGWEGAKQMAANYTPASGACASGSGCEAGKWRLPKRTEVDIVSSGSAYYLQNIFKYAGKFKYTDSGVTSYYFPVWIDETSGNNALIKQFWTVPGYLDKNTANTVYAYPVVEMEVIP